MGTVSTALRNSQADDKVANIDVIDIIDSDGVTVLVTYSVTWGAAASGTADVSGTPTDATASNSGTAATAVFRDSGATGEEITGITVATSGAPVTIDNTSITAGQTIQLTSASYTAPSTIQT
jgi:hypothetical protein